MLSKLIKILEKSTEECLEDKIAIAFSGGLDSTTIATIAKKRSEVFLFSAGIKGSDDLVYAEKIAKEIKLPLEKIILDEARVLDLYKKIYSFYPGGLLKIEIGVPIYAVCDAAQNKGLNAILFGSGAEELFVGYDRYYTYLKEGKNLDEILKNEFTILKSGDIGMIKKIAYKCRIEARFPFYNDKLAELVFQIPIKERIAERELKKGILREMGKLMHVPTLVLARKKKAVQYGSGVHKILLKHSDELNRVYVQRISI